MKYIDNRPELAKQISALRADGERDVDSFLKSLPDPDRGRKIDWNRRAAVSVEQLLGHHESHVWSIYR
jgi:hypothetical protein